MWKYVLCFQIDQLYNSHIIINSSGNLVAVYRKLHLFDVITPEFRFQESKVISKGNYLVSPLNDTPLEGGLGLLIVSTNIEWIMNLKRHKTKQKWTNVMNISVLWFAVSWGEHNPTQKRCYVFDVSISFCILNWVGSLGNFTTCSSYRKSMFCNRTGPSWLPQWETKKFWTSNGTKWTPFLILWLFTNCFY